MTGRRYRTALLCIVLLATGSQAGPLNISGATNFTTDANYQGGTYTGGGVTFSDGVTITLDGPTNNVMNYYPSGPAWSDIWKTTDGTDSATFRNEGTVLMTNNVRGAFWIQTPAPAGSGVFTIENDGVWDVSTDVNQAADGAFYSDNNNNGAPAVFLNTGTLRMNGSGVVNQEGTKFRMVNSNGTIQVSGGGTLRWAKTDEDPMVTNVSYGGTFNLTNGSLVIAKGWSEFKGNALGNSVELGYAGYFFYAAAPTTTVEVTGQGVALKKTLDLNSNVLVNGSNGVFSVEVGATTIIRNPGAIRNNGTWHHNQLFRIDLYDGVTFENAGIYNFPLSGGSDHGINAVNSPATFHNLPSGRITKSAAGGDHEWNAGAGAKPSIFRNQGSLEISQGRYWFVNNQWQFDTNTIYDGILKEGTLQATGTGIIQLPTTHANITTIDTNAAVILGGNGTVNLLTEAGLTTINGALGVREGRIWHRTGNLTIPGTLEFGLTRSDTNTTTVITGVEIDGNVDFSGGTIDVVDAGGFASQTMQGDVFTVMTWTGTMTGNPVLGNVPEHDENLTLKLKIYSNMLQIVLGSPPGTILTVR